MINDGYDELCLSFMHGQGTMLDENDPVACACAQYLGKDLNDRAENVSLASLVPTTSNPDPDARHH